MGWTYCPKPADVSDTDYLLQQVGEAWRKNVLATAATLDAVFMVYRHHDPESLYYVPDADGYCRAICIFMVKHEPAATDGYTFGYKDITETMGPCGCEAPLKIMAAASPLRPIGPDTPPDSSLRYATAYRERSLTYARQRAMKRGLPLGTRIKLKEPLVFNDVPQQVFIVERHRIRGRRGITTCFRATNGMLCNLRSYQLGDAEIDLPEAKPSQSSSSAPS